MDENSVGSPSAHSHILLPVVSSNLQQRKSVHTPQSKIQRNCLPAKFHIFKHLRANFALYIIE